MRADTPNATTAFSTLYGMMPCGKFFSIVSFSGASLGTYQHPPLLPPGACPPIENCLASIELLPYSIAKCVGKTVSSGAARR